MYVPNFGKIRNDSKSLRELKSNKYCCPEFFKITISLTGKIIEVDGYRKNI